MELYTREQLAKLLQISDRQVTKYIKQGKLRGSKLGKRWMFTVKQIEGLLDATEQGAEGEIE